RRARSERVRAEQFEREPVLGSDARIALELPQIVLRARELEVTGRLELDVFAEPFGEPVPERPRAPRERQLGEVAALLTNAAKVDAARTRAAQILLEEDDGQPRLAQGDGGSAAGDAAADDRDVGA